MLGPILSALVLCALPAAGLQLLPPVDTVSGSGSGGWSAQRSCRTIYLDAAFAAQRDTDGLTLIPPSGEAFAKVFQEDLEQITGAPWTLEVVAALPDVQQAGGAILLGNFTGDRAAMVYADGTATSEGYEMAVGAQGVFIGGTGARGMWWGTRTLLQQVLAAKADGSGVVAAGRATDAPAYRTRGYMFDAGRKWYSADFLKEMCSYASFFKMSEFHYHLSDNYPLSRGHNETWQDVYAQFSLRPESAALAGIVPAGRENQTLTRAEFEDVQAHCAARGVTLVPEIEAPGHCLYLTKWKPELALASRDLLNLSHPDTLPTVQSIWREFLPWFQTKEVHIGADEYDASLADDYMGFVNAMARFLAAEGGKRTRIWGTFMDPPKTNVSIAADVVVQHWQATQDDPVQLVAQGHDVLNSHDWWAYMSIKNDHTPIYPAPYPQFFNESRLLNFADTPGWQWTPADYNNVNASHQLAAADPHNRGAIVAAWNDNGPDASTQLEMYYALRRGIPLVGARTWAGSRGPRVDAATVDVAIDAYSPRVPGQNLDRVLSDGGRVFWTRPWAWGKHDDASPVCLGRGSKGMNYTLHLVVDGPFSLASDDVTLALGADGRLVFSADGFAYPLRSVTEAAALELDPGSPGRIWTNATASTHDEVRLPVGRPARLTIATDVLHGSVVWLDGALVGRFEVYVFGGHNTLFSWSQMAFVAPLETIAGSGLRSLALDPDASILEGKKGWWS